MDVLRGRGGRGSALDADEQLGLAVDERRMLKLEIVLVAFETALLDRQHFAKSVPERPNQGRERTIGGKAGKYEISYVWANENR